MVDVRVDQQEFKLSLIEGAWPKSDGTELVDQAEIELARNLQLSMADLILEIFNQYLSLLKRS